jgi:phenylalanine-4-hydroxylase
MAIEPVVYGASERPPRGDYSRAGADYTCAQDYAAYTAPTTTPTAASTSARPPCCRAWRATSSSRPCPRWACKDRIPRFEEINERLHRATGWEIVGVPGLIPEVPFFTLLANRKFPVTDWIRTPQEFDYIVEPDIFHDLFGHVPLLFNPVFADYVQRYGQGG